LYVYSGEFYHVIKEGKRKSDGKAVFIKTIKKAPADDPRDVVGKLRKELTIVKELSHPNVVATLDIFEDDTQFFVITEA
jgi:serine/threonine protein kinase